MPDGSRRPAISPHLKALLDEQVSVDLRASGMDEQRRIMQRALAQSFAGEVIQPSRLYMATRGEVSKIGIAIFESIKKVAESGELPRGEDSVNELVQFFDSKFNPLASGIRTGLGTNFTSMRAGAIPADQFDEHTEDVRRSEKLKIKLLMAKIMRDQSKSASTTTTFTIENSQIGILQTGETNSVASSTISLGAPETESLRQTLREIAERLGSIESLDERQREELREVALDAEAELRKEKPNASKLRGLLPVVLAGIKGAVVVSDLYEALKLVLPALGIHYVG